MPTPDRRAVPVKGTMTASLEVHSVRESNHSEAPELGPWLAPAQRGHWQFPRGHFTRGYRAAARFFSRFVSNSPE